MGAEDPVIEAMMEALVAQVDREIIGLLTPTAGAFRCETCGGREVEEVGGPVSEPWCCGARMTLRLWAVR